MKPFTNQQLTALLLVMFLSSSAYGDVVPGKIYHGAPQTQAYSAGQTNEDVSGETEQTNQTAKATRKMSAAPGTAYSQGYRGPLNDSMSGKRYAAMHTARQIGRILHQPDPWNPVYYSGKDKGWLANWTYLLKNIGVSKNKVLFESKRLNKKAFSVWAYNQMRAYNLMSCECVQ